MSLILTLHEKLLAKIFDPKQPFVFFDIGACEGLSSVQYAKIFPNNTIYAFEPVPSNYKKILQNKKKYSLKGMNVFQLALSFTKGVSLFHLSSGRPDNIPVDDQLDYGNKSSSLFKPDKHKEIYPWIKFDQSIEVITETLDNFCASHKIFNIDFIHIDVQGAELMVLKAGESTLLKVKSIWLEVEKISLYEKQPLKDQVEIFLAKNGFSRIISTINDVSGDQFWVNKVYLKQLNLNTRLFVFKIKVHSNFYSKINKVIRTLRRLRNRLKNTE